MNNSNHLVEIIIDAICAVTSHKGFARAQFSESAPLIGTNTLLDSLDIVMLIVELEKKIESTFNKQVNLTDATVADFDNSPFKSVNDLAKFINSSL